MKYSLPQRRTPRLQDYDYTQSGAYFVTICTYERLHLFGEVVAEAMVLNNAGILASSAWSDLPEHHPGIGVDAFVVMPNHVHAIIVIDALPPSSVRQTPQDRNGILAVCMERNVPIKGIRGRSLGAIVGSYKAAVTRRIRESSESTFAVWQKRYHDHIIRGDKDLSRIREYIAANPARWEDDTFYSVKQNS